MISAIWKGLGAAFVFGASACAALAGEAPFPSHDVEADCTAMARHVPMPDSSTALPTPHNQCIDEEQVAYDYLTSVWADVPNAIRLQYESMNSEPSWSRYQAWAACIQPLYEAWEQARNFQK
jgi:hypothetical protein